MVKRKLAHKAVEDPSRNASFSRFPRGTRHYQFLSVLGLVWCGFVKKRCPSFLMFKPSITSQLGSTA